MTKIATSMYTLSPAARRRIVEAFRQLAAQAKPADRLEFQRMADAWERTLPKKKTSNQP